VSREATHVLIAADNDASGKGEQAARDAGARWLAEERCVRIALRPGPGTDMPNVLTLMATGKSAAKLVRLRK
jgi:hypothetical protein